jgi:HAD superfamily hydrolase (TIGR01490 family)
MNHAQGDRERPRVAAFFDVDGTLVAGRSIELRLFAALRQQGLIPARNYGLWLAHTLRLAPRGVVRQVLSNKIYLRGVRVDCRRRFAPAPRFFPKALARVAWHVAQRHSIVLVSGTLAPLAHGVAAALAVRLAARGLPAPIGVCATRLEEAEGRWTGRVVGEAMFGEAKAHAIRRIASAEGFDLKGCYAYGDNALDRWMLNAVGHPVAVNPSRDLARVARLHDWPVLTWKKNPHANREDADCVDISGAKTETYG